MVWWQWGGVIVGLGLIAYYLELIYNKLVSFNYAFHEMAKSAEEIRYALHRIADTMESDDKTRDQSPHPN
jgi:hypothetical protein